MGLDKLTELSTDLVVDFFIVVSLHVDPVLLRRRHFIGSALITLSSFNGLTIILILLLLLLLLLIFHLVLVFLIFLLLFELSAVVVFSIVLR